MRLREICRILQHSAPNLNVSAQNASADNVSVTGFQNSINAARNILKTGTLQEECNSVLDTHVFAHASSDTLVVERGTFQAFEKAVSRLKSLSEQLSLGLRDLIGEEQDDSLAVKLPEGLDLPEMAEVINELHRTLELAIVTEAVGGQVKVSGFDHGSEWIDLVLSSVLAVSVVGAIVGLIYAVREKEIELRAKEETLNGLKIANDSLEDIRQAVKQERDLFYKAELAKLAETSKVAKDDNETIKRLENSISRMEKLLMRGLEVRPALTAKKDVVSLFPEPLKLLEAFAEPREE